MPAFFSLADHRARGVRPLSSTTSSASALGVDVPIDVVGAPRAVRADDDDVSASSDEDARRNVTSNLRAREVDRRRRDDAASVAGATDARMSTNSAVGVDAIARRAPPSRARETTAAGATRCVRR